MQIFKTQNLYNQIQCNILAEQTIWRYFQPHNKLSPYEKSFYMLNYLITYKLISN
jgi:hypothetical protein